MAVWLFGQLILGIKGHTYLSYHSSGYNSSGMSIYKYHETTRDDFLQSVQILWAFIGAPVVIFQLWLGAHHVLKGIRTPWWSKPGFSAHTDRLLRYMAHVMLAWAWGGIALIWVIELPARWAILAIAIQYCISLTHPSVVLNHAKQYVPNV
jgi:hypothetical protein